MFIMLEVGRDLWKNLLLEGYAQGWRDTNPATEGYEPKPKAGGTRTQSTRLEGYEPKLDGPATYQGWRDTNPSHQPRLEGYEPKPPAKAGYEPKPPAKAGSFKSSILAPQKSLIILG